MMGWRESVSMSYLPHLVVLSERAMQHTGRTAKRPRVRALRVAVTVLPAQT